MSFSRRGQIVESLAAGVMIAIMLTGAWIAVDEGNSFYVGDSRDHTVYDYSKCTSSVEKIPIENQVVFTSLKKAKEADYEPVEGCV